MNIRYPGIRELAERYGVTAGVISEFSKHRNCFRRRREAQARTLARADEKSIEMRAATLAVTKTETTAIIDAFLRQFERNLVEQRVRADSPADFNTLVRLKEFVEGGPDSRQEINTTISLEVLQAKHREAERVAVEITENMTGIPPTRAIDSASAESIDGTSAVERTDREHDRAHTGDDEDEYADDALDEGWDVPEQVTAHTASADGGLRVQAGPSSSMESVQPAAGTTPISADSSTMWPHALEGAGELELEGEEVDLRELGGVGAGDEGGRDEDG
jgi:hypothetical protein